MVVEVDSKDEARNILPTNLRAQAKVVALNGFSIDQIKGLIPTHP
jgi:hypothetical protein